MTPIPIPDDYQLAPFQRRLVVGPPLGQDPTGDIRPVEAIFEVVDEGQGRYARFRILVEIETADWHTWGLEPPAKPVRFWLLQITEQLTAFALAPASTQATPGGPA